MAGREDSIAVRNVLEGYLNADNNAIASSVGTAYNPTYALVSEAGAQIVLFINNADYKMYAQLKDKNGNLIYTSNIIDLPLESVVMNGRYDSTTKEVVLTLVNGNEIRFSVEDLVRGLVDEDQLEEALSGYWSKEDLTEEDIENWNNKQDYLNQGKNIQIYSDLNLKGNIGQDSTTGKNLFDKNTTNVLNCYINASGTLTSSVNDRVFWFEIEENTDYTFQMTQIANTSSQYVDDSRITLFDNEPAINETGTTVWSGTRPSATQNYSYEATFNSDNHKYVAIKICQVQRTQYQPTINTAQLEKGLVATDYEEYSGGSPSPNPSYPQDIHIVSGDNEIKVCNKNLINSTAYNKAINTSGVVIIPATTTNYLSINDYISVKPNTTYTISFEKEDGGRLLIGTKDQNGKFIERTDLGVTRTFTTGNNVYQAFFYLYKANGSYTEGGWVQLEQGSTATSYVEHKEYTKEINLGNLEVGAIGEYEDEFFKNTTDSEYYDSTLELDKWYLKKRIGKVVLDGTQTITYELVNNLDMFKYNNTNMLIGNMLGGYCNYYYNTNGTSTFKDGVIRFGWGNKYLYFMNDTSRFSGTISNFTTWLSTHNIIVYYVLATPENILLNDTLQEQLNGLSADLSNKEMINIIQENNDLPFIIDYDNTKLTIDIPCASADQGGVIKTSDSYATATANGVLTSQTKTYAQYNLLNNNAFVSKGTLENVLDKYIGDIDTALDAINGEEV